MVIDEWNGWVWTCFLCDYVGRSASPAEIKNCEKNLAQLNDCDIVKIQ